MKKVVCSSILLCWSVFSLVSAQKSDLEIAPGTSLDFDYAEYELYELQLKNKTGKEIEVKVEDKKTGEFKRGFGLGPTGKAVVMVERESKITLTNNSSKMGKLTVVVLNANAQWQDTSGMQMVDFTLMNTSAKPIPLIIPNVMNPNLSPFSNSGVELKMGQELLFRQGGKRYVLLTVDNTIKNGDKIDVAKLLKARKKELGLK
ncbi:Hypothetical protein I595_1546 [Croceitalea dokdonensis DOKDO 023]|uniref:Uncharacterized protein n=1 Tax=Croceitalea dokdonensis DOKDO 023 TaxID=1300341 RepID=A0A0P7ATW6_9FLAO|nr:hypothetical protein [Croceitalea dokdonensis]KPM31898.1 Hypothetical protein I595_1546 [Croceitalea dokdonensis DOKDO 023]